MSQATYRSPRVARQSRAFPKTRPVEGLTWLGHLTWLIVFGAAGFALSGIFSGLLDLERSLFVLVYLAVASPLIAGYLWTAGIDVRAPIARHWKWGLLGALLAGAFVVANVLGQEASSRPESLALVGNLLWLGVVYGLLDAMFLSILPIAMIWLAAKDLGFTRGRYDRIVVAMLALSGSLFVTVLYHWGFAEYQGTEISGPVIGNGVLSLAYLVSANPLASALGHVAMHVASVLHGIDTTIQLPPHY